MTAIDAEAAEVCAQRGHAGDPCGRCGHGARRERRPSECDHAARHEAFLDVTKFDDRPGEGLVEIRVRCADCGAPYRFVGVRAGVSLREPSVSVSATELRAPIQLATPGNEPFGDVFERTRGPRS